MATPIETTIAPNLEFSQLASNAQIARTAAALEAHGMHTIVVNTAAEAKASVIELLKPGEEVFISSSVTLNQIGIAKHVDESGHYDSVRVKLSKLDRSTHGRDMNKIGAVPEVIIGSVHALTETGSALIASATGSQLAPYASGAAKVIWVVGSQKIVPTLEEGLRRMDEYSLRKEDERAMQAYGMHSMIAKVLTVHHEVMPGRVTIVIVKENLGF